MKVAELIERLQKHNPEHKVSIRVRTESGFYDSPSIYESASRLTVTQGFDEVVIDGI